MIKRTRSMMLTEHRKLSALLALVFGCLVFAVGGALFGFTGNANVTPSEITHQQGSVVPNDLRPQECIDNGISVVRVITGGAMVSGDNDGDLLLAGNATNDIAGGSGSDCIVGGSAANIHGGGGTDVCIGSLSATFDPDCEFVVQQ